MKSARSNSMANSPPAIDTPAGAVPTLAVIQARFRQDRDQWRITGTSSVPGPGHVVTVYLGAGTTGPVIGNSNVDALGDWEVRERNSNVEANPGDVITITTSLGGLLQGVPVTITN